MELMVYLKLKSLYIEIEVKLKRKVRQNNVINIMKKKHFRTFNYTPLFERKNNTCYVCDGKPYSSEKRETRNTLHWIQ